jgi:DNA-binding response OmpR family regulator
MSNNTNRMLQLVNQFLDFRKAETGNIKLKPVSMDIVSFCKNIYSMFTYQAEAQSIDFKFETDKEALTIDFDPDKLDKVLFNLLSNAFKNTPEHGSISFSIIYHENDQKSISDKAFITGTNVVAPFVSIGITDSGCGISSDVLPHIFNRYFIGEQNKSEGTGIGLALADRYVQLHNGCIAVDSSTDCGSTFTVCLPIILDKRMQSKEAILKEYSDPSSPENVFEIVDSVNYVNKEIIVLVVEDNIELQSYLENTLSTYYKVVKANNGEIAYEKAISVFPDVIISDVMMPVMDGIELCKKLKSDIKTSHIPVILLTALDSVKDRIAGISTGADAYIAKPFNDELLIAQTHNLIRSRKELRELFSTNVEKWEEKIASKNLDRIFLTKAIQITEDNLLNTQFSVENLADKLNISRTHLHRKLKLLTDQSATEFIRYVRLRRAVNLMKEGKYKINEIGFAVGFNSHHYFTKSFKMHFGISPTEFNKRNLK